MLSSRMFNMVITVSMSLFYISIIIPLYYSTVQMIVQYIGACLYFRCIYIGAHACFLDVSSKPQGSASGHLPLVLIITISIDAIKSKLS